MPSYDIYLHSVLNGGQSDPTKAWKTGSSSQGGTNSTVSWIRGVEQGINLGANPDQMVSLGVSEVTKAIPAVAAAYAVVKIVEKVIDTAVTFVGNTQARQQGDYSVLHTYNNLKQLYSNVTKPFQTTLNIMVESDNRRIENERRYLQRGLLGETVAYRGS